VNNIYDRLRAGSEATNNMIIIEIITVFLAAAISRIEKELMM